MEHQRTAGQQECGVRWAGRGVVKDDRIIVLTLKVKIDLNDDTSTEVKDVERM